MSDETRQEVFEVEMKFRIADPDAFRQRLIEIGATAVDTRIDEDTYYRHPCRDFAATREALRIRRIDGAALVTYKGPKQASDVKTRQELEWPLGPSDPDGSQMAALLKNLGFMQVQVVRKSRETFRLQRGGSLPLTITIDYVEQLGSFVEVETVIDLGQIEQAQNEVRAFAKSVKLDVPESRSYLRMLLQHLERENLEQDP